MYGTLHCKKTYDSLKTAQHTQRTFWCDFANLKYTIRHHHRNICIFICLMPVFFVYKHLVHSVHLSLNDQVNSRDDERNKKKTTANKNTQHWKRMTKLYTNTRYLWQCHASMVSLTKVYLNEVTNNDIRWWW